MEGKIIKKLVNILIISLVLVLIPIISYAAVPQTINYQGYLTSSAGQPVNGIVNMTFKLYNVASGGAALWTETQSAINTQNQIVSTVPDGTAPFQVASTTMVTNLNADMVDGKHAADFVLKAANQFCIDNWTRR